MSKKKHYFKTASENSPFEFCSLICLATSSLGTSVHFIYESQSFRLTPCDNRVRVYRRPGERYSVIPFKKFSGSIMVWNGINIDEKTNLVIILKRHRSVERWYCLGRTCYACCLYCGYKWWSIWKIKLYNADITMDYLKRSRNSNHELAFIWPDTIQHVWNMLDIRVPRCPNKYQTFLQLIEAPME